mgnify:CR=1 FL=1
MAIAPITFGKALRPSTVEAINKINEIIPVLNSVDPSAIQALQRDVETLKSTTAATNKNVATITTDIGNIKTTQGEHTTDIDKIKVTPYTPLASPDTDPSKN